MRRIMRRLLCVLLLATLVAGMPAPARADHDYFLAGFDATSPYGDPITLKAQLLRPDVDCPGGACPARTNQIDFYIDAAYVGTDLSNEGGFAYILVPNPGSVHAGTHEVRAQYDREDNPLNPAIVFSELTITKEPTAVTARRGGFAAQLLDDETLPLSGFPVRFHVLSPAGDHDVCIAFTDATGTAACEPGVRLSQAVVTVPQSEYVASFDGSSDYVASSGTAPLI